MAPHLLHEPTRNGTAGLPLDRWCGSPMAPEPFLRLAIPIVSVLGELHSRNVVHKNLTPRSILVNPKTREVTIAGPTSKPDRPDGPFFPPSRHRSSKMFAYMSPEQTGRMNQAIDHRTDLYSLGCDLLPDAHGDAPVRGR